MTRHSLAKGSAPDATRGLARPNASAALAIGAILAGMTAAFLHQGVALAQDASFQPYGGVWATSRAICGRYARHISTAQDLGRAIDFVAPQDGSAYLILKRGIRILDEASSQCRLMNKADRPNGISTTLSCTNIVNPDVSTDVLDIVKSEREHRFIWKRQSRDAREEAVYQCMTMSDLGQKMARLWQFDSSKCTATVAHSGGRVTFAREPADILTVTVSGDVAADFKNDFAAIVLVDQAPPVAVTAKASPTGFSLWLEPWEARSRLIADGFLLTITTEEIASRGSGVYKVPVLELPLLGSGRAMDFLRQCQPAGAAEPPTSGQERVQLFLKSFVAQLDRQLPDYKHKMPEYKLVDLNDDGSSDIVLRPVTPLYCGSGGCTLFVYRALPDGKFESVYEKQSPDDSFPTVGPAAKGGYSTLYFPYHSIGDGRTLKVVAEWQGNKYAGSHFADGDIRIAPLTQQEQKLTDTHGVLRERPTSKAKALDQQGLAFNLGTTANEEGRWLVSKACNGCPYGYAKIRR